MEPDFAVTWPTLRSNGSRAPAAEGVESSFRWQPDVLHLFDLAGAEFLDAFGGDARWSNVPQVVTTASDPAVWDDEEAACRVVARADQVLVLTEAEAAGVARRCRTRSEPRIVPQAALECNQAGDAESFRSAHGLTGPVVLFVGRKTQQKGYRLLLRAAARLQSSQPELAVCLLGSRGGEQRPATPSNVLDLDDVDEQLKRDAYAAATIFCLPTTADVFPLSVMEARLHGVPVVVGPFPGADEVVTHGVDGLIVEASPKAVASAITTLVNDSSTAERMAVIGRRRAGSHNSSDRLIGDLLSVYREIGVTMEEHH